MSIDALNAAKAYGNQLKILENADTSSSDETSGTSFLDMVKDATHNVIGAQSKSEAAQLQSLTGKGDLTDLVTAVANAELTLNTVVAVRDKVITAYNAIMNMPI